MGTECDKLNVNDTFTVSVIVDNLVVGHLLREISRPTISVSMRLCTGNEYIYSY